MPYLGNEPAVAFATMSYQDLTGGSGTSFTLNHPVANSNEIEVFVNNVRQEPSVAYNASGTSMTMTGSIASTDDFYVVFQGKAQQTIVPALDSNLSVARLTLSKSVQGTTQTASISGSTTLDFDSFQNFVLTFTDNVTFANPTTEAVGQSGFLTIIQDGTGSRTLSLGTDYETPSSGGITLSTAANARDLVPYAVSATGSILLGSPLLAFG
tara:strand:- start:506 stop:1138 length:633 start_codon:yes stop_codon:yes gene_type:complete